MEKKFKDSNSLDPSLSTFYNTTFLSNFAAIGRNKINDAIKENDVLSDKIEIEENGYNYIFNNEYQRNFNIKTIKLLDFYLKKITENVGHNDKKNNSQLCFSFELNEYVRLLGKDPYKKNDVDIVRRELILHSTLLRNVTMIEDDGVGFKVAGIIDGVERISRGVIKVKVNGSFMENIIYNNKYLMRVPNSIFKLSDSKGDAYRLARKLCFHYGLNNNVLIGNNNVLSIHKLLQATDIQSFEQLKRTNNRNWKSKIAKKLFSLLDYLESEDIIKYDILDDKDKKINIDDELSKMTFSTFDDLKIMFTILDFPTNEEMIEEIHEKRERKNKKKRHF